MALLEIISPGNKNNQNGLNAFVRKAREALAAGLHLLIVDLFPPSPRDPQGIHRAIWDADCGEDYALRLWRVSDRTPETADMATVAQLVTRM